MMWYIRYGWLDIGQRLSLASTECEKWPASWQQTASALLMACWLLRPLFMHNCRVCEKHFSDGRPASCRPTTIFLPLSRKKTWTLLVTFHFCSVSFTSFRMLAAVCEPCMGQAAISTARRSHDSSIQWAVMLSRESIHCGVDHASVVKLNHSVAATTAVSFSLMHLYSSGISVMWKYVSLGSEYVVLEL